MNGCGGCERARRLFPRPIANALRGLEARRLARKAEKRARKAGAAGAKG